MGLNSKIGWCTATWNPFMGCNKVSAACANCYMFREQIRYGHDPTVLRRSRTTFNDPIRWKQPERIFVCSWSDFFHPHAPATWRDDAWDIMREANRHTYMLLTKRPENIKHMLPDDWGDGWPNVWLGVTAENQEMFDLRVPLMLPIPAAKYFVSIEPMLGFVDMSEHLQYLDWVIAGGESGPNFRDLDEAPPLDLRDQCVRAGKPLYFKQWSGLNPSKDPRGNRLAGNIYEELPCQATP